MGDRLSVQILSLGKHNPKLADIRRAINQGTLTNDGLLPVEGPKLIEEAQRSNIAVEAVFFRKGANLPALPASVPVYEIEPPVFKTIQSTETSQGVVALIKPRHYSIADVVATRNPLIVVLARLQDPGNVGTILRIAESFGASGLLATAGTASVLNSKTIRASAGSVFRLPHVGDLDTRQAFAALRESHITIVGTAPTAGETIDRWDWRKPTAVVIGNEGSGLSEEEVHLCDEFLRIPHNSAVESLNSAIAAAVILYEASKHRGRK
jgi:TrmH family RNA methyltransferase